MRESWGRHRGGDPRHVAEVAGVKWSGEDLGERDNEGSEGAE